MITTSILTLVLAGPALAAKAPNTTTLHCTNDPDKLTVVEVDEVTQQLRVMTNGGDEIKGIATVTRTGDETTKTNYFLPHQMPLTDVVSYYALNKTVTIVKAGEEVKWVLIERDLPAARPVTRDCTVAK